MSHTDRCLQSDAVPASRLQAHDVILQTPVLIDHLMAKIQQLYALEPSAQDCGGTAYILMV